MKKIFPDLTWILRAVLAAFALMLCQTMALAQAGRIMDVAGLNRVLAAGTGGTVLLADGDYGEVEIGQAFARTLVLKAENLHGARFSVIRLKGAANVTLDGLRLGKGLSVQSSGAAITIQNNRITGNTYMRDVKGLMFSGNEVSGGQWGLVLNSVSQFRVSGNYIHNVTEDLMRITGRSAQGVVEYNIIADTVAKKPTHPDILQFFHAQGISPQDITVRRNLLYDPGVKGMVPAQGIFLSDPGKGPKVTGYRNILIEENLIKTSSPNTIYINGGQKNVVVRRNSLIPGTGDGGAMVRLARKSGMSNAGTVIEGNVAKLLLDETKASQIGKNLFYGRKAPLSRFFSGPGERWQDFLPVVGSPLERSGMGAVAFLADLQAGKVHLGPAWVK
jgi:hypothetical protein